MGKVPEGEIPESELPGSLKLLKGLVTVLTAVMIVGFIVLIVVFVTRFPRGASVSSVALPDQITLPDSMRATAYTRGEGWYAVVTDTQEILIFNFDGSLRQQIEILPAQ
jgi:hypothetical protein